MEKQTKIKQTIDLKSYRYVKDKDIIININTGEIVTNIAVLKQYKKIKQMEANEKSDYILTPWETSSKFTKLYHDNIKLLFDIKNVGIRMLFLWLCSNLEQSTNIVKINHISPLNDDICKTLKISERSLKTYLKYLEDNRYIVREGRGKGRLIYVNPLIAFNGKFITKETYRIFKDVIKA